jgi:hypothetical protein
MVTVCDILTRHNTENYGLRLGCAVLIQKMGTIGTVVHLAILGDRQPLSSTVASNCVPRGAVWGCVKCDGRKIAVIYLTVADFCIFIEVLWTIGSIVSLILVDHRQSLTLPFDENSWLLKSSSG